MSKHYTAVFDFDGTLADTVSLMVKLYNDQSEAFGSLRVEPNEFESLRAMGYKKAMKSKRIRLSRMPKMIRTLTKEMKLHMHEVKPYEGVVEMLRDLQHNGVRIAVLTSNSADIVQQFFEDHDFPTFDFVVSEKTFFGKDKALKRIMKLYELEKESMVYVGDEPRDVIASKRAQVKVFGVSWGLGGRTGLEKSKPDRIVDTPDELFDTIVEAVQ